MGQIFYIQRRASQCPQSPSESPRHFAALRDESVIVGYYTSRRKCIPRPAAVHAPTKGVDFYGQKRWNRPHQRQKCGCPGQGHRQHPKAQRTGKRQLPQPRYCPGTHPAEYPLQSPHRQLHGDVPTDGAGQNHLHTWSETRRHPLWRADLRCELRLLPQPRRL